MVACEPKLSVWGYGEKIFPFPLLAIFSPFSTSRLYYYYYYIIINNYTFTTRNISEKNVVTYENRSEGDLLHVRVRLSFSDTVTLVKNFETIY